MRVFIAEKPSVGMDIARSFGGDIRRTNGYLQVGDDYVTWCVGHLIGQATPEAYGAQYERWDVNVLPIIPVDWKMVPNAKTREQLNVIGALLKDADCVVNCGDAAREGQLIVDEVLTYFGYRGAAKRLWLRETNLPAIRAAIHAMKDNKAYRCLSESALARSRADWIMGMNLTRGYTMAWQSRGNEGTLHIGRVQTPALCMIVVLDLEIETFIPVDFYTLKAEVKHSNGSFTATWRPPKDAGYLDDAGHVLDRGVVDRVSAAVRGKAAIVSGYETKAKQNQPPLPFSLGGLQKACNKLLRLSPSQTLVIAQALYEKHKLTTYPRTDYSHLPEDEHRLSPGILDAARSNFGDAWDFPGIPDMSLRSAAWDSSKIGDHHGLRPTMVKNYDLSKLSKTELAVYRLIVRNFLAQFYPAYQYDSTIVDVFCEGESFRATGAVETQAGWKVLFRSAQGVVPADDSEESQLLPKMSATDDCLIAGTKCEAKKTSPPPRYDGASLIEAMESAYLKVTDPKVKPLIKETGIGTPATRAAIIDNLTSRGYIEEVKEQKRTVYISTARGRLLYKAIPDQLRKPDLTAYFEELLKGVERGEITLDAFMAHQVKYVTKLVNDIQSGTVAQAMPTLAECAPPERKQSRRSTAGTEGASPTKSKAASGVPKAGDGTPQRNCPKCDAPMRLRNGANGPFLGCTGYPGCKHTEQVDQAPKAPKSPKPPPLGWDLPI